MSGGPETTLWIESSLADSSVGGKVWKRIWALWPWLPVMRSHHSTTASLKWWPLRSKREVWKSLSNSDWKGLTCFKVLTHFPGDAWQRVTCHQSTRKEYQKVLVSWVMYPVCLGIDFLGSASPLSSAFQHVQVSHITKLEYNPRCANAVCHQQTVLGTGSGRMQSSGQEQGGWTDLLWSGDETGLFQKTSSSRKPPTQKRADFITCEGFAPLPCLVDRHPLPKHKSNNNKKQLFRSKLFLSRGAFPWKNSSYKNSN